MHTTQFRLLRAAPQAVAAQLKRLYNCCPVFMEKELKEKFYKGKDLAGAGSGRVGFGFGGTQGYAALPSGPRRPAAHTQSRGLSARTHDHDTEAEQHAQFAT